jgi:hypothetical protein
MILRVRLKPNATIEQVIFLLSEIGSFAGEDSTIQIHDEHLSVNLGIAHYTNDEREQAALLLDLEGTVSSLPCVAKAFAYHTTAEEEGQQ